jgi:hypothetical protein
MRINLLGPPAPSMVVANGWSLTSQGSGGLVGEFDFEQGIKGCTSSYAPVQSIIKRIELVVTVLGEKIPRQLYGAFENIQATNQAQVTGHRTPTTQPPADSTARTLGHLLTPDTSSCSTPRVNKVKLLL